MPEPTSFNPVIESGSHGDMCKEGDMVTVKSVGFLPSRSFSIEMENLSFRQVRLKTQSEVLLKSYFQHNNLSNSLQTMDSNMGANLKVYAFLSFNTSFSLYF